MRSIGWRIASAALLLGLLTIGNAIAFAQGAGAPSANAGITAAEAWAFPVLPPLAELQAPPPHPQALVHVAGSPRSYTQAQIAQSAPDWFPQDHPPAPAIVAKGRGRVESCKGCHHLNGAGVPATASPGGLPKAYILEQFAAFRAGQRGMGAPRTSQDMRKEARAVTDPELQLAADYFSALKFVPRTRVVETATVPKMHWKYFVQVPDKGGAREPIGERVVETPANFDDYQYGSDRTAYIAYVPPGSIARGAVIASRGAGAAAACESCHGTNLQGAGVIPPLAGRSPTYIVRELILFREGTRTNPEAAPMRTEASQLGIDDMIAVAAYAASRKP
ncbi:MAG: c-type cytochrome [Rhodanobacteraceae bacterium]